MLTEEAPTSEALLDGRYRLITCIGRGGAASVYEAEDTLLERTVAVKLFRSESETRFPAGQANTEKALLAPLSHPALVTLFDAKVDPGPVRYLVMEYVDGPTLAAQLTYGALPSDAVARIGRDLAEGLAVVHRAGIVHCDVKPSNVLLIRPERPGKHWHAKLADFGIACAVESAGPVDSSPETKPEMIVGTAAYMAPEQLRHAELGPAVDIYALGLVLIEALRGRAAYPLSNSVESALVRLSAPPAVPESLGPDWVRLLTSMTRIDPAERPSAEEVAAALRAIPPAGEAVPAQIEAGSSGEEPGARSGATLVFPTASGPASAPPTRRRMLVAAFAALLLAGAGVAAAWAVAAPDPPAAKAAIVLPFERVPPPQADPAPPAPVEQVPVEVIEQQDDSGPGNSDRGNSEGNSGKGDERKGQKDDSGKGGGG
ncbi:Serine/threonine protein kinase [Microbacterium sp. HM58-2]|nr:Serine/threonine protein kinase [Microbacterium sp. HM58-2]